MDTATTDKSALAFGDDFLHGRGQSERQDFGEELRHTMDETNRFEAVEKRRQTSNQKELGRNKQWSQQQHKAALLELVPQCTTQCYNDEIHA